MAEEEVLERYLSLELLVESVPPRCRIGSMAWECVIRVRRNTSSSCDTPSLMS
jgi:hypothetical protein